MYVYFRPASGFNDILSGTIRILEYCKKYNRILLFNGLLSCYNINFSNYLDFNHRNIICDNNKIIEILNENDDFFPNTNLLEDIISNKCTYINTIPNMNMPESVILYSNRGGGYNAYTLFKQIKFHNNIKNECKRRYDLLEKPYLGIHIRNTDRKCDYKSLFYSNINIINSYNNIYIATDDIHSLYFFKERDIKFNNFTTFPSVNYNNLHSNKNINQETKFIDLICDIYLLSMSDKLLSISKGGFIILINHCKNDRENIAKQFSFS